MAIKLKPKKSDNGRWGYVDEDGDWVIKPRYDYAYGFSEGLALVRLDEKSGFIDQTGKEVVPCIYDYAWDFCEGFARVELDDKRGYIKPDGSWLVEPKFDGAGYFSEGLASVELDDKYGYIKTDGSWLVEPKFDDADAFEYGIARVKVADEEFVIDTTGKRVLESGEKLSLLKGSNGKYGFGVIYDSGTESRIKWCITPRFDEGFEWEDYIVVRLDEHRWGIFNVEGIFVNYHEFIEENDDYNRLDCWNDGDLTRFYPDGTTLYEDEGGDEFEDEYYDDEEEDEDEDDDDE